jgi:hypothetical protein
VTATDNPQVESRQALLAKLEQLTGRALRSHEEVREFVALVQAREHEAAEHSSRQWRSTKRWALVVVLALALGQYYVIDLLTQLASMRENTFFVPAVLPMMRSALAATGYLT